jgi:hypothetical protein
MRALAARTLAVAFLACMPAQAQTENALVRDRTGIDWVYPFEKARTKAAEEQRLLLIKPVAFGTSKDGCW